jgi:hypothetical protein
VAVVFEFVDPVELFGTIGMFVVMGIMAVFVAVYVWGSKYNRILISRFGTILKAELGPKCEKSKQQIFRTSGFRLYCETKRNIPLKKWEVVLFLLNRENLIHHIISKFRPHYDMLFTQANLEAKPRLRLEIINPTSKEITKEDKQVLEELKEVEAPDLKDIFIVKASDVARVERLVKDEEFVKMMNKLGDDFVRMSITDDTPNLLFASRARESMLLTHVRLAERVGYLIRPPRRKPKFTE